MDQPGSATRLSASVALGWPRMRCASGPRVVEWSTDYGDGRVYRNVSIAELRDGKAVS